jgi:hypothetical protein
MAGIRHPLLPTVLLLLVAAAPAGATLDPQPDCMGVYFDPGAEVVCGSAPPYSQLSIYVVLTGGSAPNLAAWEAGLLWEPVGDARFLGAWTVPGCLDIAGTDQDGQFQVGCGTRPLVVPALPCAMLNVPDCGLQIVAGEKYGWSAVKALYR